MKVMAYGAGDRACIERSFRPRPTDFPALPVPPILQPTLTVVVDTEEEFDWSGPFDPANAAVENIGEQHLAQAVFRKHAVVPTYVVDYPVAVNHDAVAALRAFADRGECDIGAHLHPWVTPPNPRPVPAIQSYPGNLRPEEEAAKLDALTAAIQAAFGRRPTVYKAGRYGVGPNTPSILDRLEYRVDVSLVPYTDFSHDGGPDFRTVTDQPVQFGPRTVGLPLSVGFVGRLASRGPLLYPRLAGTTGRYWRLRGIAARLGLLERLRLSPEGHTSEDMVRQVRAGLNRGVTLFMLTYHSSSLLPGATPYVRTASQRISFIQSLDRFLSFFIGELGGTSARVETLAASLQSGVRSL